MPATTRLFRVLLSVRDLRAARAFFGAPGLGLPLEAEAAGELAFGPSPGGLLVRAAADEAALSAGSTPTLCFDVADVGALVPRLLALGAHLDGAIEFAPRATVATLRAPSDAGGCMLALVEQHEQQQHQQQQQQQQGRLA